MESFVDKRAQNQQATAAWEVKNGKWVEPN
jgi:hypothetical protein